MSNKRMVRFLIRLAKNTAKKIEKTKIEVMQKGMGDIVTNADLAAETFIIQKLRRRFKKITIISEEFNAAENLTKECFIIDPIDGTVNFANGIPLWGIQIAYKKFGVVQCAVIYLPERKEMFFASKGGGAFVNGRRLRVSRPQIAKCIYCIDGSSNRSYKQKILDEMKLSSKNFRNFGAVSVSMTMLARGAIHGVAFLKYTYWDVAAGLLICKEAGAIVADNAPKYAVAASSPKFFKIVKNAVVNYWQK